MNPIDRNDPLKTPGNDNSAFAIDEDVVVLPPSKAPVGRPPLRSALLRPGDADDCPRFNTP